MCIRVQSKILEYFNDVWLDIWYVKYSAYFFIFLNFLTEIDLSNTEIDAQVMDSDGECKCIIKIKKKQLYIMFLTEKSCNRKWEREKAYWKTISYPCSNTIWNRLATLC